LRVNAQHSLCLSHSLQKGESSLSYRVCHNRIGNPSPFLSLANRQEETERRLVFTYCSLLFSSSPSSSSP
ncbi:hypothetical protein PMAYCL1PPCAC_02939, partial [Pristionchus mayeri]